MTTLNKYIGKNNAIVVAHPDDEILFAASMPIRYPDRKWTIICCSRPVIAPERESEFPAVCTALGAAYKMVDHRENLNSTLDGLTEIDLSRYDTIVTHNEEGEYGHQHHIQVHRHVKNRFSDRKLIFFGPKFGLHSLGITRHGVHRLNLDYAEVDKKMQAFQCYASRRPYGGKDRPQHEILTMQFYLNKILDFKMESFDVH